MIAALTLSLMLAHGAPAPEPFNAEARIQEAIGLIRPIAYRSPQVDWAAVEADMRRRSEGAVDSIDMLPAYAALMYDLGDHHSFIQPPDEMLATWHERHGATTRLLPDTPRRPRPESAFLERTDVTHRSVALTGGHKAELVVVPSVEGSDGPAHAFARDVFAAVADASGHSCGYIVDLRGNTGGNVWPMLTGLSSLLGEGPPGSRSVNSSGNEDPLYAILREGSAVVVDERDRARGRVIMTTQGWRPMPGLTGAPVAVLIDKGVYSSGEGVAVAFHGRPVTRFFGEHTGGLASVNDNRITSDKVNLVVTIAILKDRNGMIFPEWVEPDEIVLPGDGSPADPDDAQVEAAKTWLATQGTCAT